MTEPIIKTGDEDVEAGDTVTATPPTPPPPIEEPPEEPEA